MEAKQNLTLFDGLLLDILSAIMPPSGAETSASIDWEPMKKPACAMSKSNIRTSRVAPQKLTAWLKHMNTATEVYNMTSDFFFNSSASVASILSPVPPTFFTVFS